MIPQIYADGISNITFVNGMVRIDLASTPPVPAQGGAAPTAEVHHRIIVTPRAFLQSMGMMQDLLNKLVEAGVVRRTDQSDTTSLVGEPPVN
ncbi:MAG: hypothetical protein KDC18_03950 [Alphaproteobacteria bacterium]|nr:hypothetical protein [Alphaproteobacteria bacterium]MCB9928126.1 hypothetical protein [Alphaproteobacteria bacterium]